MKNKPEFSTRLDLIQNGTIESFFKYSTISLKKSRYRKKFRKNPSKYLSEKIRDIYFNWLIVKPAVNMFKCFSDFDMNIEPIDMPIGKLYYIDKK